MLLATASGFCQILAISFFASVFTAPISTLAEGFSVDGSAVHGLDYGRLRLWASLSFLLGNLGGGALLLHIPITSLIYLIAVAQGGSALVAFLLPPDPERERPLVENSLPISRGLSSFRSLVFSWSLSWRPAWARQATPCFTPLARYTGMPWAMTNLRLAVSRPFRSWRRSRCSVSPAPWSGGLGRSC